MCRPRPLTSAAVLCGSVDRYAAGFDRRRPLLDLACHEMLEVIRRCAIGTDLVAADRTTSDYLKQFVASEIKKWAAPIKASGVSVD